MANKLKSLVLKELSLVDNPANVDSVVTICKRAVDIDKEQPRDELGRFASNGGGGGSDGGGGGGSSGEDDAADLEQEAADLMADSQAAADAAAGYTATAEEFAQAAAESDDEDEKADLMADSKAAADTAAGLMASSEEFARMARESTEAARLARVKKSGTALDVITKAYLDPQKGSIAFSDALANDELSRKYWKVQEEINPLICALNDSIRSTVADSNMSTDEKNMAVRTFVEQFLMALREYMPEVEEELMKFATDFVDGSIDLKKDEGNPMPTIAELETQVATLTKSLTKAVALSKMSDDEKNYMKAMDDKEREAFMAMTGEQRKEKMKVAKAADESLVVDGTTVTKSAVGDATFAVLKSQQKRLDDQAADLAKSKVDVKMAELVKMVDDQYGHLVGTAVEKAHVLRHMETASEEVRKTFDAIMKAAEETIKKGFGKSGHGTGKTAPATGSAAEQLETLAKAHATEHKVEYAAAYTAVIEKRADLYEQALSEGK